MSGQTIVGQIKKYWWAITIAASAAVYIAGVAWQLSDKRRATVDDIQALKDAVEDSKTHGSRITALEVKTTNVPDQLTDIQRRLSGVEGKLDLVLKLNGVKVVNSNGNPNTVSLSSP